ncbi:hypothetical protein KBZ21_50415, partial [Streptomyces sp. A73]|nr:hypothetical protein [Streptomyces sp. A73]
ELRFYDATDTQVAAHRATLAPPGTGIYRQVPSGVAPAGAVTAGLAVGMTGASAGQVARVEGSYLAVPDAAPNP